MSILDAKLTRVIHKGFVKLSRSCLSEETALSGLWKVGETLSSRQCPYPLKGKDVKVSIFGLQPNVVYNKDGN